MRPPAFSAVPFRQGLWGRQKKNRAPPSPALTSACAASPLPRLGATVSTACLRGPPPRRRRRRRPSLRATGPRRAAGSSRPRRSPGRRPSRPSPRPPPSRRRVRSAGAQPGGSSSPLALARLVVGGSRRTLFVFNMNRAEFAPKNEQAAHREPSGIRGGGGACPRGQGRGPPRTRALLGWNLWRDGAREGEGKMAAPLRTQHDIRETDARGVPGAEAARELGVGRNTASRYAGMSDMSPAPPPPAPVARRPRAMRPGSTRFSRATSARRGGGAAPRGASATGSSAGAGNAGPTRARAAAPQRPVLRRRHVREPLRRPPRDLRAGRPGADDARARQRDRGRREALRRGCGARAAPQAPRAPPPRQPPPRPLPGRRGGGGRERRGAPGAQPARPGARGLLAPGVGGGSTPASRPAAPASSPRRAAETAGRSPRRPPRTWRRRPPCRRNPSTRRGGPPASPTGAATSRRASRSAAARTRPPTTRTRGGRRSGRRGPRREGRGGGPVPRARRGGPARAGPGRHARAGRVPRRPPPGSSTATTGRPRRGPGASGARARRRRRSWGGEDPVPMGDVGCGKARMASASCVLACQDRVGARLSTASAPATRPRRARDGGGLDRELAKMGRAGMPVVDGLGLLPLDADGAHLPLFVFNKN